MSQNSCLPSAAAPAEIFVIVARDDMLVNPESALAYAGTARGKSLELTGGCGHFAFMCEEEKIRAAVAAFLNGEDINVACGGAHRSALTTSPPPCALA